LHAVARAAVGLPHDKMVRQIGDELERLYPGHIERRPTWFLNLAGGALGVMTLLHGSLSEYVFLFGSPIGTEGFSGRYPVEIFDFVLAGEMWTFGEDDVAERQVFRPGDVAHLPRGRAKGYRLPDAAWMLEYGRGVIPAMLPFGLSGAAAALEVRSIAKTIRAYGRLVARELRQGKI
jgi:C-8 sterol isomerase